MSHFLCYTFLLIVNEWLRGPDAREGNSSIHPKISATVNSSRYIKTIGFHIFNTSIFWIPMTVNPAGMFGRLESFTFVQGFCR